MSAVQGYLWGWQRNWNAQIIKCSFIHVKIFVKFHNAIFCECMFSQYVFLSDRFGYLISCLLTYILK